MDKPLTKKEMLCDMKKMLVVLKALTPKHTSGYFFLQGWIKKYAKEKGDDKE